MKCVIIDDDKLVLVLLRRYIEKTEGIDLMAEFSDPTEGAEYLKSNEVDFAFLDVEMPSMTGIEMISYFNLPQIILISSKKEYAADAFDYDVSDFIAKPIKYDRFLKSIDKVRSITNTAKIDQEDSGIFFIKDRGRHVKLDVRHIMYIEAIGDYVTIHTDADKYTILSTMKYMEKTLSVFNFIRIHRSYIINLEYVKEFEDNTLYIKDKMLTISRFYKPEFLRRIKTI